MKEVKWYDADKVQPNCHRTVIADCGTGVSRRMKFRWGSWWYFTGLQLRESGATPIRWRENNAILKLTK